MTKEKLLSLTDNQLITIWNRYCLTNKYFEDIIYCNAASTFLEVFPEDRYELIKLLSRSSYNMNDSFFCIRFDRVYSFNNVKRFIEDSDVYRFINWLNNNYNSEDLL